MNFEKLYNDLHPYIVAVYKGGSNRIPFIKNPHDRDYEVYIKPDMPKTLFPKIFTDRERGEDICVRRDGENVAVAYWTWSLKYSEVIVGNDILKDFDFFTIKDEWINVARDMLQKCRYFNETGGTVKRWYHVLAGLYVIENGGYDFTEEQIENIRLLHDRQGTVELYDYIKKKLGE